MNRQWQVGDAVKWTSQSNGGEKEKRGTIWAVVEPGKVITTPDEAKPSHIKFDTIYSGSVRRYVVAVPRGGMSKVTDYYCPYPGLLQADGEGNAADASG